MEDWALPEIDMQLCDRCGACVEHCPTGAVDMLPEGPCIARPADCTYCARCDAICPQNAITCTYEITWERVTTDCTDFTDFSVQSVKSVVKKGATWPSDKS